MPKKKITVTYIFIWQPNVKGYVSSKRCILGVMDPSHIISVGSKKGDLGGQANNRSEHS